MATIIRSPNDLKICINAACNKSVENACNRLLGSLQQIIDDEFFYFFFGED